MYNNSNNMVRLPRVGCCVRFRWVTLPCLVYS